MSSEKVEVEALANGEPALPFVGRLRGEAPRSASAAPVHTRSPRTRTGSATRPADPRAAPEDRRASTARCRWRAAPAAAFPQRSPARNTNRASTAVAASRATSRMAPASGTTPAVTAAAEGVDQHIPSASCRAHLDDEQRHARPRHRAEATCEDRAMPWQLTIRSGPKFERQRFGELEDALETLDAEVRRLADAAPKASPSTPNSNGLSPSNWSRRGWSCPGRSAFAPVRARRSRRPRGRLDRGLPRPDQALGDRAAQGRDRVSGADPHPGAARSGGVGSRPDVASRPGTRARQADLSAGRGPEYVRGDGRAARPRDQARGRPARRAVSSRAGARAPAQGS